MSEPQPKPNGDLQAELRTFQRIGSRAVLKAQEESRRLRVPNVYSHRGRVYFELPDGELSLSDPLAEK